MASSYEGQQKKTILGVFVGVNMHKCSRARATITYEVCSLYCLQVSTLSER